MGSQKVRLDLATKQQQQLLYIGQHKKFGKFFVCTYMHMHTYIYMHLEKAMAPHSSPLAWKIPWTEEPGGLQSMGSLRVGHD